MESAYSMALKKRKMDNGGSSISSLMNDKVKDADGDHDGDKKEDEMHDLAPTVKDGLPGNVEAGDAIHPMGNAHDDSMKPDSDMQSLHILMGAKPSEHDLSTLKQDRKPRSLMEAAQMAMAKRIK